MLSPSLFRGIDRATYVHRPILIGVVARIWDAQCFSFFPLLSWDLGSTDTKLQPRYWKQLINAHSYNNWCLSKHHWSWDEHVACYCSKLKEACYYRRQKFFQRFGWSNQFSLDNFELGRDTVGTMQYWYCYSFWLGTSILIRPNWAALPAALYGNIGAWHLRKHWFIFKFR